VQPAVAAALDPEAQRAQPPQTLNQHIAQHANANTQVRPVLSKLKTTLVGAAALLLACTVLLTGLIKAHSDEDGVYGALALAGGGWISGRGSGWRWLDKWSGKWLAVAEQLGVGAPLKRCG